MYKVFVNKSLIILTEKADAHLTDNSVIITYTHISQLSETVNYLLENVSVKPTVIVHFDIDELWSDFINQFKYVHAAGGMVFNEKNEFLIIHRNDKWDLPKGHLKKGERPSFGGMREVEEECGVNDLTIVSHLDNTFHMYERNGLTLKKTFWYIMKSNSNEILTPQFEEGIDKVEWKNEGDIKELIQKSYPIIEELLYLGTKMINSNNH